MTSKFCHNCGCNFHKTKDCQEPTISCGLITIKLPNYQKIKSYDYLTIEDYNFKHLKNLGKLSYYMNKIKFLLIRRKHSFNFIEFIRGKYEINKEKLIKLFELMSPEEILLIDTYNFKDLWEKVWGDRSWLKSFEKEFKNSETKFIKIQENKELFYYLTRKIVPLYDSPEWGLPKGRRDNTESNIECGIREFCEETSLTQNNITIINNVAPLVEDFIGTNNKKYKSIFYLATLNKIKYKFNIVDNPEVGDIGFFTLPQATNLIRDYHQERIKVIEKSFLFTVNMLEQNKINNNLNNIIN
ncbi:putative NUDIX-like hydrolase [Cafeteria roenbergensis virus]|uniref:Putative NUDIX-like hydrolase n=1 Tax=Cafeteria roenbergensis virus (strain BV-PW1) TaxID=693272 RepID=E3T5L7_CROVB|nr:putative NUDIX-like hydrolase [Cafeteria roenbergensis virus BV-PW1]ADO67480.1 putative NUDIX-like hydrolase [Cafeteria roenbergensis virus BV-PW1]